MKETNLEHRLTVLETDIKHLKYLLGFDTLIIVITVLKMFL